MKDKVFSVLQRVGRSFMLPIAILPVAGLLLGIGSSFTNATTIETYGLTNILGEGTILHALLIIMSEVGGVIFDNLPLIFAVGVAIGMSDKEREVAALSAVIAYFVMHIAVNAMLIISGRILENGEIADTVLTGTITSVCGIPSLQMGVFGGVIVGLGVAFLHNRFYRIQLPNALSFFGGTRFVPIISTIVYMFVGIFMYFIWPVVQNGIYALGGLVAGSGYIGTLIFGLIKRALIPFGLHHVFYMPFWQTELGGTVMIDGNMISGAQNIFFAELASKGTEHFSVSATRFMTGKFPVMIFGLPAAAFAIYKVASPEKKKQVGGLLLSAALTSMITGITEPLEFTFLFVAPLMYAVHCVFTGISYMLMHLLNVTVGMTFSGGVIDLTLFGILQGNNKTNWLWIILVGGIYAVIYFFVFYYMIKKFDYKTPGREENEQETKLYTRKDLEARKNNSKTEISELILNGLGGKGNISDIDCCATRLRVTVIDSELVSDELLKQSGASGVVRKGNGVQVIYGPKVSVIKSNLEDFMESDYVDRSYEVHEEQMEQHINEVYKEQMEQFSQLASYMNGTVILLEQVEDEVFSQKIIGDGIAIEPDVGELYSPCDGKVEMVFDTKHAVNLVSDDGCEILLHIGIDTVKLGGKYFEAHVSDGQEIRKGDLLISFKLDSIRSEGYKTTTPLIICNTNDYSLIESVGSGKINVGESLLKLKK